MVRDDVLVGGHDGLAGSKCGHEQRLGRLIAAHHLDDDVDLGIGHEVRRRIGQQIRRDAALAGSVEIADGDANQCQHGSVGAHEATRAAVEPVRDGAPDRPRAEHGHAHRLAAQRLGS
jgi:hypothetical protein